MTGENNFHVSGKIIMWAGCGSIYLIDIAVDKNGTSREEAIAKVEALALLVLTGLTPEDL